MKGRHANISVFVPHLGCPNKCSFCNQHYISGAESAVTAAEVEAAVKTAMATKGYNPKETELAFFGGSFTAIDYGYMEELLLSAQPFLSAEKISGIRISTRPDAIDEKILEALKKYGVTAIELGAQSMCDNVLEANERGHSAEQVRKAATLIKKQGFSLGLQMMTGLYKSEPTDDIFTACELIRLSPDTVRIYPTIVLHNTRLAELYKAGEYRPQSLNDAIGLAAKLLLMFEQADIKVIRTGLHSIEQEHYVAGPWHPAFSELCLSEIFLEKALKQLKKQGEYIISVNKSDQSKMIGQKRSNIKALAQKGFICTVLADDSIKENTIKIKEVKADEADLNSNSGL